jgi:hypothetical protein
MDKSRRERHWQRTYRKMINTILTIVAIWDIFVISLICGLAYYILTKKR